jgi:EmrB/QacA subfamily drug resistance transporter
MTENIHLTDDRSRWIALVVLCVGMLMIVLDATVVNVALPSIQTDLGFTQSSLAWVVNAYLIAFGGLLLLAGRLGDLISRRGVFLAGLGVFTVASLVCGIAQSQEVLVAARFVQGVGGAMTSAVILGMIVTMFPEPREQAKAIGVYSFVASAGGSVGLLAGGVLTQAINWHWIFFVNIPIGIATAVFALRLLDKDKGLGFGRGADVLGAVLITGALMLLVYTIVKPAADYGWGAGRTLGLGAASLALLVAFVAREATARNPLIPLRIFRSRNVSGANAIQALFVAGMFSLFFLGALYLQRVLGYDALETGLAFLPVTVAIGALSLRYSERLIMRFGAKATLLPGLVLIAAGLGLFTRVPVDGDYLTDVLPTMLLLGTGAGLSFPALMTLAMSGARRATRGWRRAWSTPRCRWAARSGSPCSPPCRPPAATR